MIKNVYVINYILRSFRKIILVLPGPLAGVLYEYFILSDQESYSVQEIKMKEDDIEYSTGHITLF